MCRTHFSWSFAGRGPMSTDHKTRRWVCPLDSIDQTCLVACAEAVVDVYHRDVAGATVQHAEQRGESMKAGPVSYAGRHRDHGAGDQAADHAGERAFHAGADHHHTRL